ncbi:MAG TPA: CxxxxCH/CxxCH domain-containing protein, partial [Anaeromyxobacteraceae bacterium]|nr:CxxxxCH/CxxCH domain-containing protein [Anaeromyxobacteraceae bacterium]
MLARTPFHVTLPALALALAACGDARPVQEGTGGGGCTSCHGTSGRTGNLPGTDPNLAAAPPVAPAGAPAEVVGAHQAHLNPLATGSLRGPIACSECHDVPQNASHATTPPAQKVHFGTLATTGGAQAAWNGVHTPTGINTPTCSSVYCHGNFNLGGVSGNAGNAPDWTVSGQPACTTCHGLPPAGHFPLSGTVTAATCNGCHSATVDSSGRIIVAADGSSPRASP